MARATSDSHVDDAIERLIRGTNGDPFAVLGPHLVDSEDGTRLHIRTCQPSAESVELVWWQEGERFAQPMSRRHPQGVFEAVLPVPQVVDYRLRVTWPHDHVLEIDDPYRYGRILSEFDLHLFGQGRLERAFERFGAHCLTVGAAAGVHFAVWAPSAQRVSVVGDFNGWDGRVHAMRNLLPSGVWEIFIPGLQAHERYKFEIRSALTGDILVKTDPYAQLMETPPRTASVVWRSEYQWRDQEWMETRPSLNAWLDRPMSIYEVHLGSWRRVPEEGNRSLTYRELADQLVPYVRRLEYTHIELMPVMEHPFFGSWGYQVTGFFAPTSRYGTPDDFKYLIDECHRNGIGVILDWVPAHFPRDMHALARFDGTALYEHDDPRQGEHLDWGTLIFNYGRAEVRNFLLTNALFWLKEYHADGLRVDAVASMLYLDYSRPEGQWIPNRFGGRENLDAVEFLRQFNSLTHREHPGTVTAAEESTAWAAVSRPTHVGGLGFTYKWNMGWMHDMLRYIAEDPIYRRYSHTLVTFSMLYAYSENYVLPFSHDEVVYGKRALADKVPGDAWQKRATLRLLYGYMYGHPGKKLLFMGGEIGQWHEWNHDGSLDWPLLEDEGHAGIQRWVRDLNRLYAREPALHELDLDPHGFRWIDCNDNENSVFSLLRYARREGDFVVAVVNFTPIPREGYRIGVPEPGRYLELLNSDAGDYGGSGVGNDGSTATEPVAAHGYPQSLRLTIPPLGCLFLKLEAR
jgi:1,4-alpha-glucan branching enzyme